MDDNIISRQDAIDYLMTNMNWYDEDGCESDDDYKRECITELINGVPPAEPQKGKWIDAVIPNDNGGLPVQVCDQCNTFFPLAYTGGGHHYCPNCGARMEVDNE